jgi:hypothetical protein
MKIKIEFKCVFSVPGILSISSSALVHIPFCQMPAQPTAWGRARAYPTTRQNTTRT